MSIEQIYNPEAASAECIEKLRDPGAFLLRGFVPPEEQAVIIDEVLAHDLTEVDRSGHTIPEQFQDIGWEFRQSPPTVFELGRKIGELVRPNLKAWFINQVRAQLYTPGEVGIEWHRDYKRDLRVIAIASFMGEARFDIKLDDEEKSWCLEPGDLALMRGSLLNGNVDDRPLHRVDPPEKGQRLSIAYRQVASQVPDLEARP